MLKRTVAGFRVLRSSPSRVTRRKLYHADQVVRGSFGPEIVHPFTDFYTHRTQTTTERRSESAFTQLDNLLSREAPKKQAEVPLRKSNGALANEIYVREFPQQLIRSLKLTSDSHVRLETLLKYKDPLRVYFPTLEKHIHCEFGVENASDLVSEKLIGADLTVKLLRYALLHKRFDQVSEMYHSILVGSFNDQRLLQKMNLMLFNTLQEDHDLELGFAQLMKWLYRRVDSNVTLMRFMFSSITTNGKTLADLGFKHHMFLDVLRIVQIEAIVCSCSDIEMLPEQYKNTGFDFVDISFALRLIQRGKQREALLHLESRGVLGMDGVFHRFVLQALRDSPLDKREIARILLSFFKRVPGVRFGIMDKSCWTKAASSQNYHRKTIDRVTDENLKNELRSMYLKKLISKKQVNIASDVLRGVLKQVDTLNLNLSTVAMLLTITKDSHLLKDVVIMLTPMRESLLFHLMYSKEWSKAAGSTERLSPEAQLRDVEWLLAGFDYKISNHGMLKMIRLISSLPESLRHQLLRKIKGPSSQPYIDLLKACKSAETTLEVARKRVFRTRDELKTMAHTIASTFATDQIIKFLTELKHYDEYQFNSLHQKITLSLIAQNKIQHCSLVHQAIPYSKSVDLLTDALIVNDPNNVSGILETVSTTSQDLRTKTWKRLADSRDPGMSFALSKDVKRLARSTKLKGRATTVLVAKHTIDGIKRHHNGKVIMTNRLAWALDQCSRYNVPKAVIAGLID